MKTIFRLLLVLCLLALFIVATACLVPTASEAAMYSPDYRIDQSDTNAGGGPRSSTSHEMVTDAMAEPAHQTSSSPGYSLTGGLLPVTSESAAPILSTITAPANGATLAGANYLITGTATSVNGIAFVELSFDNGDTWLAASGATSWSYAWTLPPPPATVNIRSRATDANGNRETPGPGITVTIVPRYDLTVLVDPPGTGTVTVNPPTGPYPAGSTVTITAIPDSCHLFSNWSGGYTGSDNPHILTITADTVVTANFVTRRSLALTHTQNGRLVTMRAELANAGVPLANAVVRFYSSTNGGVTWSEKAAGSTGANGTLTKTVNLPIGTYVLKAVHRPSGCAAVTSNLRTALIAQAIAISPASGFVTPDSTPTVTWAPFIGATGYVLQTCPNADFTGSVTETADLGAVTSGDLPLLPRGVNRYWRVIALIPEGRSVGSAARAITYREATSLVNLAANLSGSWIRPTVTLQNSSSAGIGNKPIYFSFRRDTATAWTQFGTDYTDAGGLARLGFAKKLTSGSYRIKAVFKGDAGYLQAEAEIPISVP